MRRRLTLLASLLFVASAVAQTGPLGHRRKAFRTSAAFTAPSAAFTVANTRIDLTTGSINASSTVMTASFWINVNSTASMMIIFGRSGGAGPQWYFTKSGTNTIGWRFHNSSGVTTVEGGSDAIGANNTWNHILFSIDTSDVAKRHIWINGVDANDAWTTYTISGTIALDRTHLYVGTDDDNGSDYGGCMAQVWIDDVYTDFSNSANRAKFASGGSPVNLGTDGSTPFGTAPPIFLRFVSGSLNVNSGTLGGSGTVGGTLTNGTCGTVSY